MSNYIEIREKFKKFVRNKAKNNLPEGSFIDNLLAALIQNCEKVKTSYPSKTDVLSETQYFDYIFQQLILKLTLIEENARLGLHSGVTLIGVNYMFDPQSLKKIQEILVELEYLYKECEFLPLH